MAGEAKRMWAETGETAATEPLPDVLSEPFPEVAPAPEPSRWPLRLLAGAMLALAVGWIVAVAAAVVGEGAVAVLTPLRLAAWVGLASGPLALMGVLALLAFRTGAVDAGDFARRARTLRNESQRLAELLGLVNRRIEAARTLLAAHGDALTTIGEDAGERLGATGAALRADAEALARTATLLDDATAAARTDMGVLLADLPDAEGRAITLAEALRRLGQVADGHVEALGRRLESIDAQARSADQSAGGAARRLAAELERIESAATAADLALGQAAGRLAGGSDRALEEAARALDDIRRSLDEQGSAIGAMVAHARAGFADAGDEAARSLARQIDALDQRLDRLAGTLRTQDASARGSLGQLEIAIGAIEDRLAALGETGAEHTADIAEAIVVLSGHAEQVGRTLRQGADTADTLVGRAEGLRAALQASGGELNDTIPAALGRLRLHADQGVQMLAAMGDRTQTALRDAERVAVALGESGALIESQQAAVGRLAETGDVRLAALTGQLAELESAIARTQADAGDLADRASPALAAALAKVRDAAGEAAAHARDALAAVIPEAAERLADAAAREVTAAIAGVGRTELAQVGIAAAQAVDAARGASERLTGQLLAIGETTQVLEARVAAHKAAAEAADEDGFARAAGLLIEALNSTAIDVAKLFSNEPTDIAWAAYLKGDRGVFTRRAVRLLDTTEARAIGARYAQDADFHGQVDRYVHDFEALLRRVLAARGGDAMAVTMLSADMGKLYVALAQAIERLRR